MEIEAKFRIPDEGTFLRALEMDALLDFDLGTVRILEFLDRYFDTVDRAALKHRYACRIRQQGARFVATLKGLGESAGPVHRRSEYEVQLPDLLLPFDWPPGDARELALRLFESEPLVVLFEIKQTRHLRHLFRGSRPVAELSLDRFEILRGPAVASSGLELEVELMAEGSSADMRRIVDEFLAVWRLMPETQSKFERAMAVLNLMLRSEPESSD